MGNVPDESAILAAVRPLIEHGVAIHWLHRRSKRPVGADWQNAPVHTLESLKAAYQRGFNVGIRPGEFSKTPFGYLHLFDMDIRKPELAAEAWACLLKLWPDARSAPFVISGSGGESRHIYVFTPAPLKSMNLGHSEGFSMVFDATKGRDVKKWDWAVDLYGAPKQAVLPPSLHDKTGDAYVWGREIDWDMLDMGIGPVVSAEMVESWGAREDDLTTDDDDDLLAVVRAAPMGLSETEIDEILRDLPEEWVEDHDLWVQAGMALHHEYEGRKEGFTRWCEWSRQSEKFDLNDLRNRWKSFKERRKPVRMATLIKAAGEARLHADHASLDEMFDDEGVHNTDTPDDLADLLDTTPIRNLPAVIPTDLADILDTSPAPKVIAPGATVVDPNWRSYLQMSEDGKSIKPTAHNIELIIRNDPRTADVIAYNEFTQEIVQIRAPKKFKLDKKSPKPVRQLNTPIWTLRDPHNGDLWSDQHDSEIRIVLEAPRRQGGYAVKVTDRDLKAAVDRVGSLNRFHPIQRYLEAQVWDGVPRMERLFIDYVGAEDNDYHREAAMLWMIGAVARVYDPGHKFDFVPILEGLQGVRKSTFFNILARHWFAELNGDFHDRKGMVEQMQGAWILELPELQGFSKADVQLIKAFVSARKDKVRLSYDRRAKEFKRQVVFGGTTNDVEYLRDSSGGRRFWPIACNVVEIDTDKLRREVDQLWAEAKAMHDRWREQHGEFAQMPLYMQNPVAAAYAKEMQESRRQQGNDDVLAARIAHWLNQPINTDLFDDEDLADPVYRNEVCLLDIWHSMMSKDVNAYSDRDAQLLGRAIRRVPGWVYAGQQRTDKYGKQRVYRREGTTPLD